MANKAWMKRLIQRKKEIIKMYKFNSLKHWVKNKKISMKTQILVNNYKIQEIL